MASIQRNTLVAMMANGFSTEQVAAHLQVPVQAFEELLTNDPALQEDVERFQRYKTIDNNLDRAEERVTKQLMLSVQFETDVGKLSRALTAINSARRRSLGESLAGVVNNTQVNVVQLRLPRRMETSFVKNSQAEVVEVDGSKLLSMPAQQLLRQIKEREDKEEIADDYMPAKITERSKEDFGTGYLSGPEEIKEIL